MIGGNDTGKSSSRCYEEGFEWESELVERRIAAGCANNAQGSDSKTTKAA